MTDPRSNCLLALLCAMIAVAACGNDGGPPSSFSTELRVVQGVRSTPAVDVLVDGSVVLRNLAFGQVSGFVPVPSGTHVVLVRPAGTTGNTGQKTVSWAANIDYTIVAIDSSSIINPIVLTDTGAVPAPGMTKLRVVHFATNAPPIDVWRTQPDYQTLITIMFPFDYRAASPYLQSTPGVWSVVVSSQTLPVPPNAPPDTLLATGPISIPANGVRTIVLLDKGGGGLQARILEDR